MSFAVESFTRTIRCKPTFQLKLNYAAVESSRPYIVLKVETLIISTIRAMNMHDKSPGCWARRRMSSGSENG